MAEDKAEKQMTEKKSVKPIHKLHSAIAAIAVEARGKVTTEDGVEIKRVRRGLYVTRREPGKVTSDNKNS